MVLYFLLRGVKNVEYFSKIESFAFLLKYKGCDEILPGD